MSGYDVTERLERISELIVEIDGSVESLHNMSKHITEANEKTLDEQITRLDRVRYELSEIVDYIADVGLQPTWTGSNSTD